MAQYGFYFDQTVCAGCHTCQIACKDKNRLDVGTLYRKVRTFETGEYPNPGIYHLATTCNHCDNPACVAACPLHPRARGGRQMQRLHRACPQGRGARVRHELHDARFEVRAR